MGAMRRINWLSLVGHILATLSLSILILDLVSKMFYLLDDASEESYFRSYGCSSQWAWSS